MSSAHTILSRACLPIPPLRHVRSTCFILPRSWYFCNMFFLRKPGTHGKMIIRILNIKYRNLGGNYCDKTQGICAEKQTAGGNTAGSQEY